jgi:hypothetical protein
MCGVQGQPFWMFAVCHLLALDSQKGFMSWACGVTYSYNDDESSRCFSLLLNVRRQLMQADAAALAIRRAAMQPWPSTSLCTPPAARCHQRGCATSRRVEQLR